MKRLSWFAGPVFLLVLASLLQAEPPRLQINHKSTATCVAWSFDGKQLASGSDDGTVRVFDAATGKELHKFQVGSAVSCLGFSPDGKRLALSQTGQLLSIWDVAQGQRIQMNNVVIAGYKPTDVVYKADGNTIIGVGHGELTSFNAMGGLTGGSRVAKPGAGGGQAVAPDGSISGWCDGKGLVRLRQWMPNKVQSMNVGNANALAFGPQAKWMAVAGDDRKVHLWDLNAKNKTQTLEGLPQNASKLAFSLDGQSLAGLAADNTSIRVWDLGRNRLRGQINHNRGPAGALALSPDGKQLATIGLNGQAVLVWNVATREVDHKGPPLELSPKELAALWTELAGKDFDKADAAWRKLAAAGDNAVPFLRDQIRPIAAPAVDRKLIDKMIVDLDSDRFVVREKATKELTDLGELIIAPLQRTLDKSPSGEVERRALQILKQVKAGNMTPDRMRVLEAIELLEQSKSVKGLALLQEIERDALIPQIQFEARQALQRMTAREKKG